MYLFQNETSLPGCQTFISNVKKEQKVASKSRERDRRKKAEKIWLKAPCTVVVCRAREECIVV